MDHVSRELLLHNVAGHEQLARDPTIRADTCQYGLLRDCLGLGLTVGVARRNVQVFILNLKGA